LQLAYALREGACAARRGEGEARDGGEPLPALRLLPVRAAAPAPQGLPSIEQNWLKHAPVMPGLSLTSKMLSERQSPIVAGSGPLSRFTFISTRFSCRVRGFCRV
jgi:hypothetical protein